MRSAPQFLIGVLLVVGLAHLAMGCSSMSVKHDYDRAVDFTRYKTFGWVEQPQQLEDLIRSGIRPANLRLAKDLIERDLRPKGLQLDEEDPDILIAIFGGSQDRVDVQAWGYGHDASMRGRDTEVDVYEYEEGGLLMDFIDAETDSVIWRGWATCALEESDDTREKIREAVSRILERYPPK
jgi:hypothetical protein